MSEERAIVDTDVFVSARNRNESGSSSCRAFLDRFDQGDLQSLASTITIAELRAGLSAAEAQSTWQAFVSHLLASPNFRVEPVDVAIAEGAGELRQRTNLSLPDALIVTTGKLRGAAYIVSQDLDLNRKQTLLEVRAPNTAA